MEWEGGERGREGLRGRGGKQDCELRRSEQSDAGVISKERRC